MIKIKLFEAFTFDNKVLLCNTILYRFLIEKFIKGYQLTFKLQDNRLKVWDRQRDRQRKYLYFVYNPVSDVVQVFCFIELTRYLKYYGAHGEDGIRFMIEKASIYVFKKIYLNEKNKTI